MEMWEKIKAAKEAAEAAYPKDSHQPTWEEREMAIFHAMVQAATGQWEPSEQQDAEPPPAATREVDTPKLKGK